jgi:hypothetical protein
MPAVVLPDRNAYKKAFQVLMRVGGPFQGRGEDTLIVSDEQYEALMQAGLVSPNSPVKLLPTPKAESLPESVRTLAFGK